MSDRAFAWGPFDWAQFLVSCSRLTPAERGIYITLLAMMMEAGGPIEVTPRLHRSCNLRSHAMLQRALDVLVDEGHFMKNGEAIWSPLAATEMERRERIRTANSRSSHKSARHPGKNTNENNDENRGSRPIREDKIKKDFSPLTPQGEGRENDFLIDKNSPDWDPWIEYIREAYGDGDAEGVIERGWFYSPRERPPGAEGKRSASL